ncbi:MAG: hypothetical protein AB7K04_08445, partial [Pseudorhodoplanes sp.]
MFFSVRPELPEIIPEGGDFVLASDAGEDHCRSRNARAGIADIKLEAFRVPDDPGFPVGFAVAVAFDAAGAPALETGEDGANLGA